MYEVYMEIKYLHKIMNELQSLERRKEHILLVVTSVLNCILKEEAHKLC